MGRERLSPPVRVLILSTVHAFGFGVMRSRVLICLSARQCGWVLHILPSSQLTR